MSSTTTTGKVPPPRRGVRINNVVSHSTLGCKLDPALLAVALCGRFNAKLFQANVGHCRRTRTTCSVFRSGELVVVGAKSDDTALLAAYIYADAVRRHTGLPVSVFNFEINNVAGDFSLGYGGSAPYVASNFVELAIMGANGKRVA